MFILEGCDAKYRMTFGACNVREENIHVELLVLSDKFG